MRRLLFFVFIVAMLLPARFVPGLEPSPAEGSVGAGDMVRLVTGAGRDVAGLCEREPEVCSIGSRIGRHIRERSVALGSAVQSWLTNLRAEAGVWSAGMGPSEGIPDPSVYPAAYPEMNGQNDLGAVLERLGPHA